MVAYAYAYMYTCVCVCVNIKQSLEKLYEMNFIPILLMRKHVQEKGKILRIPKSEEDMIRLRGALNHPTALQHVCETCPIPFSPWLRHPCTALDLSLVSAAVACQDKNAGKLRLFCGDCSETGYTKYLPSEQLELKEKSGLSGHDRLVFISTQDFHLIASASPFHKNF